MQVFNDLASGNDLHDSEVIRERRGARPGPPCYWRSVPQEIVCQKTQPRCQ